MTEQNPDQKKRDDALRKAYSEATKRLREAHLDEFNALRKDEAQKLGIAWEPKPTKDQKAEAELKALLAENPALAERLTQQVLERYHESVKAPAADPQA